MRITGRAYVTHVRRSRRFPHAGRAAMAAVIGGPIHSRPSSSSEWGGGGGGGQCRMEQLGRKMRAGRRRRTRGPEWRTKRGRGSRGRFAGACEAGRRGEISRFGFDSVWSYFFTSIDSVKTRHGLVSWQKIHLSSVAGCSASS